MSAVGPDVGSARPRSLDAVADGSSPVVIADRALLYNGDYRKVGFDLVISDGETRLTIHDYFRPGHRPDLVTPDGTSLSGAVVEALATSPDGVRVAQAGAPAAAPVIGRVESVSGAATAVRNGVTVTLNAGDPVYRGDAVQTGGGSSVNITLIDGTALNVAANARMVLNDMVYQAGGTGNSALLSLVQGSVTFLAGQVAKTGDMKVDTPVATMGIRGTMPSTIVGENGATRFSVLREPDGTVGTVVLFSKVTGLEIARVNQAGVFYSLASQTSLPIIENKTPAEIAADAALAQRVFDFAVAAQQRPVVPDVQAPGPTTPDGSQTSPGAPGGATGGSSGAGGGGASTFDLPIPGQNNGGGNTAPSLPTTPQIQVPPLSPINLPTSAPLGGNQTASGGGGGSGGGTDGQTGGGGRSPGGPAGSNQLPPLSFSLAPDGGVDATGAGQSLLQRDGVSPETIAAERVTSVRLEPDGPEIPLGAGPTFAVGRYGVLSISPDGTYSYLALSAASIPGGAVESDVFTFTVDSAGTSLQSTLSFAVTGVNDAPQTGADAANAAEDGIVTAALRSGGLLGNDIDPDRGETAGLTIVALRLASGGEVALTDGSVTLVGLHGTLTVFADGTYSYAADRAGALRQGEVGRETLTYVAADASGLRTEGSFEIRITGFNDDPSAAGDAAGVAEGGSVAVTGRAAGLLGNDSDIDGGETALLAVVAARAEASAADVAVPGSGSAGIVGRYGTLTIRADGTYAYAADNATALGAEIGVDSFVYTVRDPFGAVATATLAISVQGRDDPAVITGSTFGAVREAGASGGDPSATGQLTAADPDGADAFEPVTAGESNSGYGTFSITADGLWTYTLDNANAAVNALDTGDSLRDSFTVFSADGTAQTITIAIAGANDAPTVTEAGFTVAEGGVHVLAPDDIDVADPDDAEHTYVVSAVMRSSFERSDDSGTWSQTAAFTDADLAAGRIRFAHDGSEVAPTFTIVASDGETSSAALSGSVTLTPVNDPPTITGPSTGTVREDQVFATGGQLSASDPDAVGPPSWRVVGSTDPTPANFDFRVDTLRITRSPDGTGGALLYEDRFDGTAPTVASCFGSGLSYTTDLRESGGRGILDDETGVSDVGVGTPDIFDSVSARLRTNRSNDPANAAGLKKGADFTVAATYDLATSLAYREAYGIRLTDRSVGNADPSFDNIGDDLIELVVRRGTDGDLRVQLRDYDVRANTVTNLQGFDLVTASGEDQITLRLMHAAGAGSVTAAFDLLSAGVVQRTVTFTVGGSLFGSATTDTADDELFTTAQLIAFSPATADSALDGTYGTLVVNQAGRWDYTLRNGDPAVQALGPNDTRQDVFTIRVTDDGGASDDQVISVNVQGTNDAPVVTSTAFPIAEGGTRVLTPDDIDVFDPDNAVHSYTVSGVARGSFQVRDDSGTFASATQFTDAQIAAGAVRFIHDGGEVAPTFSIRANDGLATGPLFAGTAAYMPVNDRPVLDLNGTDSMSGGANYDTTVDDDTSLVDAASGPAGATILDVDSPNLASAFITIRNPESGDLLFIADEAALAALGLSAAGAGTGAITLGGSASLSAYAEALKLIRFGNEGTPEAGDRLIDFVVSDGAADSDVRTTTLTVQGALRRQLLAESVETSDATNASADPGETRGDPIMRDSVGGHDAFEFPGHDPAESFALREDRVEAAFMATDWNATMTGPSDDASGHAATAFDADAFIRFLNVSKAELQTHPGDFAFV